MPDIDRWFLSDCEGRLEIWREAVLRHVTRDEHGEIDGYALPAAYKDADLIASWDLSTWDEGEDPDDDARRRMYAEIVQAHNAGATAIEALGTLQTAAEAAAGEVEQLRAERARAVEALGDIGRTAEAVSGDLEDGINAELLAARAELDAMRQAGKRAEEEMDFIAKRYASATWERDEARAENEQLAEQVERVRAEHPKETYAQGRSICAACRDAYEESVPWPCPTIRALNGAEYGT